MDTQHYRKRTEIVCRLVAGQRRLVDARKRAIACALGMGARKIGLMYMFGMYDSFIHFVHTGKSNMSCTFIYSRVSTADQTTDNQIREIESAGFAVEHDKRKHRIFEECISGSIAANQRSGLSSLLARLESGDVLIVTKLDRLGRNAIDVQQTVAKLAEMGVRVHCLQLGGADLASSAGKMTMAVITAVAEFERDLLIERTQAGLKRAKDKGR